MIRFFIFIREVVAATMQRRPNCEETSRQQCSGGQIAMKHRGNNAAGINLHRNIVATMQRRSNR
jgi:hypothetical protein